MSYLQLSVFKDKILLLKFFIIVISATLIIHLHFSKIFSLFRTCSFILLTVFLFSCNQSTDHGKSIFHYNESSGIASLDPAFAKSQSVMWGIHQLYNTLVQVDDSLHITSSVAKTWEFDSSRTTILFHLRSDVFFHNDKCFPDSKGRKLNASDVVYSLGRIVDKNIASPGGWIFNDRIDSLLPFSAPDDSTFILKLCQPFQPVLGILSMQYCSIVPREAVEFYKTDFRRHPVGSGPFQFVAWEESQELVLKKNPHFFETDSAGVHLPYLDGLTVKFYDSKATEFLDFQQGRLDFINDIDPSFKDEVLTRTGRLKKEWEKTVVLQKHPYLNTEYLGILVDSTNPLVSNSPLRIKKLRQAINYAIDRRKMMLYLRNSIGLPAVNGFVPPGLPSFDADLVKGYDYDPVKAAALLKEAGFENGKGLPVIKLLTIPIYGNLASYIANELQQIGIPLQVEVIQKSLLMQQTSKQQAPFFRASWIADYPDAENYLSVFYGKNPAPPNYTRFHNATYDRLYERSMAELDESRRYELYREMDKIIIEEAPIVPLWYDEALHLVRKNISGFTTNSLNMLELRYTKKLRSMVNKNLMY